MTAWLPAAQALAAERCASCPKMCRSTCPTLAVTANERHQPWGHARAAVAAGSGARDGFADGGVVDSAYACAVCSACTPACRVEGVETPDLAWAVRAAIHSAGATPAAGVAAVAEARAGRVPGGADAGWSDPAPVLDRLRGLATPGAPLLLWPGCGTLGRRPGAALAAGRALRRLGVEFQVPPRHWCCGMPALSFGDGTALNAMLDAAAGGIRASGATRVAVQSPSCSTLLGTRAAGLGRPMPAEVVPLAAVLAAALVAARPAVAPGGAVAYHDPCHLARHQSVRDQPRTALRAAGLEVAELAHHGDATRCSGQGGGLPLTHPRIARGYLGRLAEDAVASPAPTLVTGCGSCAAALEGALPGRRVLELAEAVAAALGEAPG